MAWSSAEMPPGTSCAVMTTPRPTIDCVDFPDHRHRAGEGGVVGDEVDGLDDPDVGNDVDVSSLDDVGVSRGLPRGARSIVVGQYESVRASRSGIEVFEGRRHPRGREPRRHASRSTRAA